MEIKLKEYAVEYTLVHLISAPQTALEREMTKLFGEEKCPSDYPLEKKVVPCNKAGYVKDVDLRRAMIGNCEVVSRSLPFLKKTSEFVFVPDNIVCIENTTNEEGENIHIIHTVAGSWLFFGFDGYCADRVGFAK